MLEQVRDSVIAALTAAGMTAEAAYPHSPVPGGAAKICVGVCRAEDRSPGFARFLGLRETAEQGPEELYGLRCGITLSLDIYAPLSGEDGSGDCLALFDAAAAVIGDCGIRLTALRCGEPAPDRNAGMMHLRGEAEGLALLLAPDQTEAGCSFQDFVLKGELNQ